MIELHGTDTTCTCMTCRSGGIPQSEVIRQWVEASRSDPDRSIEEDMFVPKHVGEGTCGGGILKADVTFFGESLPAGALARATVCCLFVTLSVGKCCLLKPSDLIFIRLCVDISLPV